MRKLTNQLTVMMNEIIEREQCEQDVIMMQKERLAKRYDISKSQVDKLIKEHVFVEDIHFSRPTDGHPLFYVKSCDEAMLPKLAKGVR